MYGGRLTSKGASGGTFPAYPVSSGGACCVHNGSAGPHFPRSRHAHSGPESLLSFNIRKKLRTSALSFTASSFSQRSVGPRFISRSRAVSHCLAARGAWPEGHPFATAFASKSGARRLFLKADRTMRAVAARKTQRGCRRGLEGGAPWGGSPKQHPPSPPEAKHF